MNFKNIVVVLTSLQDSMKRVLKIQFQSEMSVNSNQWVDI